MTDRRRTLLGGLVLVVLATGGAARLFWLHDSRINGEHQYQSALIARRHFLLADPASPAWRIAAANAALDRQRILEAPIGPWLISLGYRLIGRETLTLPRLATAVVWLAGCAVLFGLMRRLASVEAATVALSYAWLAPSAVLLSVSFLPDAPMVTLMAAGLWTVVRFFEHQSARTFALAWLVSSLAILTKPVSTFPIGGAILALAVGHRRLGAPACPRTARRGVVLLAAATATGTAYYMIQIAQGGELAVQAATSVAPELLLAPSYWAGWLNAAVWAAGILPLTLALVGVVMAPAGTYRHLLLGLWAGYVVYCLVFSYHVRFAGHYHLMLVPIVALSIGPLVPRLTALAEDIGRYPQARTVGALALLLALTATVGRVREAFADSPALERADLAAEIGDIVGHSTRTVFLASYYGVPLEYYGELAGEWWRRPWDEGVPRRPASRRSVEDRFRLLGFEPDYFIITDFGVLRSIESDLESFLSQRCTLVAQRAEYLVFSLKGCLPPPAAP